MALQSELNAGMIAIIRELTGARMAALPSSLADFENAEMRGDTNAMCARPRAT
ncbi:hypothetical protein MXD81_53195 [Microbacteriaceae bacterium K1510]|nr:hypothetical protein [Microbacteriaceae bacterium K1510]